MTLQSIHVKTDVATHDFEKQDFKLCTEIVGDYFRVYAEDPLSKYTLCLIHNSIIQHVDFKYMED